MTQFNFTTNIEKRMPQTGKVYCIDRMTSDYAEQHPMDVDGFIESVYQEFVGTEFEESREVLRSIWTAVLSVTSPCGDASLYPNKNGAKRAAAMKVWAKAGDYWRRGFRQGDPLPDMVPMTKITRLEDGAWIALFPKDAHLLSEELRVKSERLRVGASAGMEFAAAEQSSGLARTDADEVESPKESENVRCRQLDLFETEEPAAVQPVYDNNAELEQLQQENDALKAQIEELERLEQERRELAERLHREEAERRAEQRRRAQEARRAQAVRRPVEVRQQTQAVEVESDHAWLKMAGYVAAASVALLVIWQTGLIIPLGLIGLATSGLLK